MDGPILQSTSADIIVLKISKVRNLLLYFTTVFFQTWTQTTTNILIQDRSHPTILLFLQKQLPSRNSPQKIQRQIIKDRFMNHQNCCNPGRIGLFLSTSKNCDEKCFLEIYGERILLLSYYCNGSYLKLNYWWRHYYIISFKNSFST